MDTQLNMMCCWEGPHWEPTPYNAFFFELKKWYDLCVKFGSKKNVPKNGNLALQEFIKAEMDNFE